MRKSKRINSLMYHDLVEDSDTSASGFTGAAADRYKQTPANFELHLDSIQQRCGEFERALSVEAALQFTENSRRWPAKQSSPWLLTFDDGGVSAVEVAKRLEQRNSIGHFFVTTSRIGADGFLDVEQIRSLRESGHVIGAHSHTHPVPISALTFDQLLVEWHESVSILTDILKEPVTAASVPGGFYSKQVAATAADAGIRTLFTSEPKSKIEMVGDCTILGRYTILRRTSADVAASFAAGDVSTCLKQGLIWNAKKVVKKVLGTRYVRSTRRLHDLLKGRNRAAAVTRNG